MINKQENKWNEPYLRTDLPAEEHDRLVAELRADPHLLGKLLQLKSPEDENLSAALLFDDPNVPNQDALDDNIRRYLLRDPTFTDEEIGELEELMLEDERYFERVMLVEDELIEDYLRGALSPDETKRFNNYFLVTPERREKLAYVEALALSYVKAKETDAPAGEPKKLKQSPTASAPWWQFLLAFLRPPNLFAGVAAASVLMFVAVGTLWLTSRQAEHSDSLIAMAPKNEPAQNTNDSNNSDQPEIDRQTGNISPSTATPGRTTAVSPPAKSPQPPKSPQRNQERKQNENRKSVPSEPADKLNNRESELNNKGSVYVAKDTSKQAPVVKPNANEPRPDIFELSADRTTRSGGGGVEKKIEPGVKDVELRLPLDVEREYDDFRVVVQDSDGNEVARREKLKATTKGNLPFVTAKIPAKRFKPDDYTVILSGGTKGVYQEAARYSFRVIK